MRFTLRDFLGVSLYILMVLCLYSLYVPLEDTAWFTILGIKLSTVLCIFTIVLSMLVWYAMYS